MTELPSSANPRFFSIEMMEGGRVVGVQDFITQSEDDRHKAFDAQPTVQLGAQEY